MPVIHRNSHFNCRILALNGKILLIRPKIWLAVSHLATLARFKNYLLNFFCAVGIFLNSSGSHHSLCKLDIRIPLALEATRKNGGIYLYSNQKGGDGDRLYYNGYAMVIANGEIVAQGSRFSLSDVEVVTATVDIEEVRAYRFAPSRGLQSLQAPTYQRTETNFSFSSDRDDFDSSIAPSSKLKARYHLPEEDIGMGPACWLWDYLRRSKAAGS